MDGPVDPWQSMYPFSSRASSHGLPGHRSWVMLGICHGFVARTPNRESVPAYCTLGCLMLDR